MSPVDCVTDIVSQDVTATLKVLYALFKKHKGKWKKTHTSKGTQQPTNTDTAEDMSVSKLLQILYICNYLSHETHCF